MRIFEETFNVETDKDISMNICHLSDLHCTKAFSKELMAGLLYKISGSNPSHICITGDICNQASTLITNPEYRSRFTYFIDGLRCITNAKIFMSLGNHDIEPSKHVTPSDNINFLKTFEKKDRVYLLNNEQVIIDNLQVTGFSPRFEAYNEKYVKYWTDWFIDDFLNSNFHFDNEHYNVFMCHSPLTITDDEVLKALDYYVKYLDLILSGHMHNGLMPKIYEQLGIIKGHKGFSPNPYVPIEPYCRGIHKIANANLVISRGVRKWVMDNPLFDLADKAYDRDITTINVSKKR